MRRLCGRPLGLQPRSARSTSCTLSYQARNLSQLRGLPIDHLHYYPTLHSPEPPSLPLPHIHNPCIRTSTIYRESTTRLVVVSLLCAGPFTSISAPASRLPSYLPPHQSLLSTHRTLLHARDLRDCRLLFSSNACALLQKHFTVEYKPLEGQTFHQSTTLSLPGCFPRRTTILRASFARYESIVKEFTPSFLLGQSIYSWLCLIRVRKLDISSPYIDEQTLVMTP